MVFLFVFGMAKKVAISSLLNPVPEPMSYPLRAASWDLPAHSDRSSVSVSVSAHAGLSVFYLPCPLSPHHLLLPVCQHSERASIRIAARGSVQPPDESLSSNSNPSPSRKRSPDPLPVFSQSKRPKPLLHGPATPSPSSSNAPPAPFLLLVSLTILFQTIPGVATRPRNALKRNTFRAVRIFCFLTYTLPLDSFLPPTHTQSPFCPQYHMPLSLLQSMMPAVRVCLLTD